VGVDDRVILSRTLDAAFPEPTYVVVDVDRRLPLLTLTALFVGIVILLGRRRGTFALLGFALSVGIIGLFVLPAIVAGKNPVAVAVVGSAAVMLLTLYLAHGVNIRTTAAELFWVPGMVRSSFMTGLCQGEVAFYLRIRPRWSSWSSSTEVGHA
jgi:uncharacterized membrane protein